ncbi:MAG: hypothetical protein U0992_13750 [Planctomycetaceae bacterium]
MASQRVGSWPHDVRDRLTCRDGLDDGQRSGGPRPLGPAHTHEELADIPIVDKASLTLMANNEIMLDQLEQGEFERAKQVVAWYLWAAKSPASRR